MKRKRVIVAMSGGVDSSVAAALLVRQGYEVIGITMCFNLPDAKTKKPTCCGRQGIEDARQVAHKLGIRHYVSNMQAALNKYVVSDFCQEYLRGRTPNPCVRCNQFLKFQILLNKAEVLGAEYLATGHYARIIKALKQSKLKAQSFLLKKGRDQKKDQSYFLYRLNQKQLKYILFPLGSYTKVQVRKLATEFNLPVAEKIASQEICFLPGADYRAFLKEKIKSQIKPGPIIDKEGNILGEHKGIVFYTIGQREGLGIAKGYPLYVIKIDPERNEIVVGEKDDACKREFLVRDITFIGEPIKKKVAVRVRIRYNHTESLALLEPAKDKLKGRFKKPQFAVTPGQSAVFFDKDTVLGGGIIDEVLS